MNLSNIPASQRLLTAFRALPGKAASSQLLRNSSWVLLGEAASRVSRLVTILVMAAVLPMTEYGIAMLALACHEMMRTLTRLGASARIIQCEDKMLAIVAGNVHVLNAAIALLIFSVQFMLAPEIAAIYGNPSIAALLQLMAISYLFYPLVAVRASILQRNEQMRLYSLCNSAAVISDNLGTALLLALGAGLWSVAAAKIVGALVWVAAIYCCRSQGQSLRFDIATQLDLLRFSIRVFSSDCLRTLRSQLDVLLAGKFLGDELLGIYAFAKSAGIGISIALSNAFLAVSYPRLAQALRGEVFAYVSRTVWFYSLGVAALFILQSLLSPYYIVLLFDSRWHEAGDLVAMLCLTAIPALWLDLFCMLKRVQQRLGEEVAWHFFANATLLAGIFLMQPSTPKQLAIIVCSVALLWLAPIVILYGRSLPSIKQFKEKEVSHSAWTLSRALSLSPIKRS